MPKNMMPLAITWMISIPIMAPNTPPDPPESGVAPMTAAMTVRTKSDPSWGSAVRPRNLRPSETQGQLEIEPING